MAPKVGSEPVAGASGTVSTDPNDPDAPHDAGIYLFTEKNNVKQMIPLEPTVYTAGKTGGVFKHAITYGIAKAKWKAVVRGPRANMRTTDAKPVFYFYFEEKSAGLSRAGFGVTTSPNEFTLVKFEVKSDSRETAVMQMNALGASSLAEPTKRQTFRSRSQKFAPEYTE